MIYSAGVTQLALVAYVPDPSHNKSASKIDVQVWMDHVLTTVGGGNVITPKTAATSPKGGHIVVAAIPGDADKVSPTLTLPLPLTLTLLLAPARTCCTARTWARAAAAWGAPWPRLGG